MSKFNQKHLLLALVTLVPLAAMSPSQLLVERSISSIEPITESEIEGEVKADLSPSEEVSATETQETETTEEAKVEIELETALIVPAAEKEETKVVECSAENEIQDLEKEVEKAIAENQKLIDKFEKLNNKYDKNLKELKHKAAASEEHTITKSDWDFVTMALMTMMFNQQFSNQSSPGFSYIQNPLNQMSYFGGPAWSLPSQQPLYRNPSSYNSWEHSYYNIPSMGAVNHSLTPQEGSLTSALYPSVYLSNGQGRTLRAPSEIAPARGYTPQFLAPGASSQRLHQDGFAF